MAIALPGPILRLSGGHLGTVPDTLLFGLTIVAAAFLLTWAAETAEIDVSPALSVAFIGLIAVLPEYAVDLTFAWKAGQDPTYAPFAVANMTGANRLLVGAAWPLVFFLFWLKTRRRVFSLERGHSIEIIALAAATIYSFTIPLKGSIALYDTVILGAIFAVYVYFIARAPTEEPELLGPARTLGALPRAPRLMAVVALFAFSALVIIAVAEAFAEGLIHTGVTLGVDEFLLVQWVAPFASEAPEFLIASILAFRGRAGAGMGALISSKVNQWTLLIGGLPIAYGLSSGSAGGLPLDDRQGLEVFLTAAQSAFAVAILASLSLSWWEAALLFVLFAIQFAIPTDNVRLAATGAYLVLTALVVLRQPSVIPALVRYAREAVSHPSTSAHRPAETPGGH
jgi:cation:H+ antiporter